LDQVAARVVEDGCRHRSRLDRLPAEADTETPESLEDFLLHSKAVRALGLPMPLSYSGS
jgi:hypothetical protein